VLWKQKEIIQKFKQKTVEQYRLREGMKWNPMGGGGTEHAVKSKVAVAYCKICAQQSGRQTHNITHSLTASDLYRVS